MYSIYSFAERFDFKKNDLAKMFREEGTASKNQSGCGSKPACPLETEEIGPSENGSQYTADKYVKILQSWRVTLVCKTNAEC